MSPIDKSKTLTVYTADIPGMYLFAWVCTCGTLNVDNYVETVFPICSDCNTQVEWEDLLSPEQFDAGNAAIVSNRRRE